MKSHMCRKWHPENFQKRLNFLQKKQQIIQEIRAYFDGEGFMAVDTPALQISPGIEPHLKAFKTELDVPHLDIKCPYYLHTSPEFAMKKLLVAGLKKIYQICHVFRNEAYGPQHRPEFLMIEWYRVGASLKKIQQDCQHFIQACARCVGVEAIENCALFDAWESLSVYEAFEKYAALDIRPAFENDPYHPCLSHFRAFATKANCSFSETDRWEDLFFKIFLEHIEPNLGTEAPVFLTDYPVAMAALSKPHPEVRGVAMRFELYIKGVELANAFGELTDPKEQRRRFDKDLALKKKLYGESYPIDEDFLDALEFGMPDAVGIALGVDRLVMLLVGAQHIDEVNFM